MDSALASPGRRAMRRLRQNTPAMLSAGFLILIAFSAFILPFLLPESLRTTSSEQYASPSWHHFFGTDLLGRDLFYRVLIGARVSLLVGFAGAAISLVIGTAMGLIAGYAGGWIDNVLMRGVDILHAIPRLLFIIIFVNLAQKPFQDWIMGTFGVPWMVGYAKIGLLIICLGLIEWLTMARIVRGQVLSVKSLQFVTAARSLGETHFRILMKHILPNVAGVIIVYLTLTIPAVILDESFLSFLGLGVDASQSSWGTLLSAGAEAINPINSKWWLIVFPGLVMSLTLLALNFLGDGLRDALDPKKQA